MDDKKLKMELLEELMGMMDESIGSKLKPMDEEDEVKVTSIESKEMPMDDVKEMIKDKMMGGSESEDESDEMEMELDVEEDGEGDEESDIYEDGPGMSDFERRLNALKRKK